MFGHLGERVRTRIAAASGRTIKRNWVQATLKVLTKKEIFRFEKTIFILRGFTFEKSFTIYRYEVTFRVLDGHVQIIVEKIRYLFWTFVETV